MIITNRQTKTYTTRTKGFYIDVCEKEEYLEGWIYNEEYGIKMMMFGIPGRMNKLADLVNITTLLNENEETYIQMYKERYLED